MEETQNEQEIKKLKEENTRLYLEVVSLKRLVKAQAEVIADMIH